MNRKKRTPAGAATSAGVMMEAETGRATTSKTDHTTVRPLRQAVHISDFLFHGALTGLDNRTIRRWIERERRFARSMQHRAREILRTARAIEGAAGLD